MKKPATKKKRVKPKAAPAPDVSATRADELEAKLAALEARVAELERQEMLRHR